jgi:hypothetical protein
VHLIELTQEAEMAITRIPFTRQREQSPPENFAAKCGELLRGMEEQKALAREMIETARRMCDRAAEMRKPPHISRPCRVLLVSEVVNGRISFAFEDGQE